MIPTTAQAANLPPPIDRRPFLISTMKTDELREAYFCFFESKGCVRRPSDALVPKGDKTVLFTPAGIFTDRFSVVTRSWIWRLMEISLTPPLMAVSKSISIWYSRSRPFLGLSRLA